MKKRILALAVMLALLVSALTVPVSAATKTDVYNFFKNLAMRGEYDSDQKCYSVAIPLNGEEDLYYGIYYLEKSKNVEISIFDTDFEVTLVLTSSMKLPYTAYILVYDSKGTKGSVNVPASYNGEAFGSFAGFSGNQQIKTQALDVLNNVLPYVIELSRNLLFEKGYSIKDMGLTGFKRCTLHYRDQGRVTQAPTCVSTGVMTYTCRICGKTETESISATGKHTWEPTKQLLAPTCTKEGMMRYTCSVCKKTTKDEPIPALGHAWKLLEQLTPSTESEHGTAKYICPDCGQTKQDKLCASVIFTDMPDDAHWAHKPIDWAYFNGVTAGSGRNTFSPGMTITRSQAVTFLWAAAGRQEPADLNNPFKDVNSGNYFFKPVLWAREKGVTSGTGADTFGPLDVCTRSQIVTFLWAAAGKPEPKNTQNPFIDVKTSDYFFKAVLWAKENGVTSGTGANTFGPYNVCTREQVVTFLYKANQIPADE